MVRRVVRGGLGGLARRAAHTLTDSTVLAGNIGELESRNGDVGSEAERLLDSDRIAGLGARALTKTSNAKNTVVVLMLVIGRTIGRRGGRR